jgi:hypothetical protein
MEAEVIAIMHVQMYQGTEAVRAAACSPQAIAAL